MNDELNILILSCGTRNKIVQYFKKELSGRGFVLATDCSNLAPALYEADKYIVVPGMDEDGYLDVDEDGYLDVILSICKENNIKAVLSLIDPELTLLAQHKQSFLEIGTLPIVSDVDVVELSFDKYKMFEFLVENGFKTIKSYIDKEKFYVDVDKTMVLLTIQYLSSR